MATIHAVTGHHGHIGKTTFSTVLEHTLTSQGLKTVVVDADYQKQTTTKLYGDDIPQVIFSRDPDFADTPDEIIELAYESPEAHIVVDLAADTDRYLNQWLEDRGLLDAAKDEGIDIYKWWVSDSDYDSLSALASCAQQGDMVQVNHILVKSHYSGRAELWPATLNTHEELKAAISAGAVKHIDFYRGFGKLVAQAQRQGLTWNQLMADTEYKLVKRLNHASYKRWLDKNKASIASVYQPIVEPVIVEDVVEKKATAKTKTKKTSTRSRTAKKASSAAKAESEAVAM